MSAAHPLPSLELIAKAQAGNKLAINKLIAAAMWIVTAQVRRWARIMPDEDKEDLQQIALAGAAQAGKQLGGLMRAIQTFDRDKGNNFWTHCTTWVTAELQRTHASRKSEHRRMPGYRVEVELHDSHNGGRRGAKDRDGEEGSTPDPVQLAAPDNPEAQADARMQLAKLSRMPHRMRMALAMRVSEQEFADIGEELGVSREWARRIYQRSLGMARLALSGPPK